MKCIKNLIFISLVTASYCTAGIAQETAAHLSPQPQVSYKVGDDSKVEDGLKGNLQGPFLFQSKILEDTIRQYWIYVPPQYDASKPAAVLVFQDGARAINPNGVLRVQNVLENLIAKKQIPVTIGIFITPGQRGDDFPASIGTGNPDNRDREYDVLDDKYTRFIAEEMLPEVSKKYNLTDDPAARTIGGSSSGGICAFTVAWHRPDQFRNVISMIGSFTDIHGGHVYPEMILAEDKKPIRIFLQDGKNDNRSPQNPDRDWYLQNQKMKAALEEKGYDYAYVLGEGAHSDDHGGAMLPLMLRWIYRDYPGVESTTEDLVALASAITPETIDPFPGFNPSSQVDPIGDWTWQESRRQNTTKYHLRIGKHADALAGNFDTAREGEATQSQTIGGIEVDGNKLTFNVKTKFRNNEANVTYTGIIEGNKIRGWSMVNFSGNQRDSRWQAERQ